MSFSPEVQSKIENAKSEVHSVFSLTISGTPYIYRSINRSEFKSLQEKMVKEAEDARIEAEAKKKDLPKDDPKIELINQELERKATEIKDRGEDRLVSVGLVHPVLSPNTPAGVPSTIADRIMQASGFGVEEEPEQL